MKLLKNEKGSAAIYLLWMMTVIIVLSIIIVNVVRVYAVKQQASAAAQLGAIAATSEILIATEDAIKEFDEAMMEALEEEEDYEPLWDIIVEKKNDYLSLGYAEEEAFIKALNEILPGRLGDPILKNFFEVKFRLNPTLSTNMYRSAQEVIKENEGNEEHLEILISSDKYRVEVRTDATYETITDGTLIDTFTKDIPQEGYGPPLSYLKYVLN